jgi:hypothetical protein
MALVTLIYEQSVKTFARRPGSTRRVLDNPEFVAQLGKLKKLLSVALEPKDLGLDKSEVMRCKDPNAMYDCVEVEGGPVVAKAATYIGIGKTDDVSIGIFIIHPGNHATGVLRGQNISDHTFCRVHSQKYQLADYYYPHHLMKCMLWFLSRFYLYVL